MTRLSIERAAAEAVVTSSGWLAEQPKSFQTELLRRARLVEYSSGVPAFVTGDEVGGIQGIVRGSFRFCVPDRSGHERLAHLAQVGTWIGHPVVFATHGRSITCYATEPAQTLQVGLGAMNELIASFPETILHFNDLTRRVMRVAIEIIADQLIPDSERRIGATLLRAGGVSDDQRSGRQVKVILAQAQLAEMANVSRHLVNSALARFKKMGWVKVSYNCVVITDADGLRENLHRSD